MFPCLQEKENFGIAGECDECNNSSYINLIGSYNYPYKKFILKGGSNYDSRISSKIAAGPLGSQLVSLAGPTANLRASGPRARSIFRAAYMAK